MPVLIIQYVPVLTHFTSLVCLISLHRLMFCALHT